MGWMVEDGLWRGRKKLTCEITCGLMLAIFSRTQSIGDAYQCQRQRSELRPIVSFLVLQMKVLRSLCCHQSTPLAGEGDLRKLRHWWGKEGRLTVPAALSCSREVDMIVVVLVYGYLVGLRSVFECV